MRGGGDVVVDSDAMELGSKGQGSRMKVGWWPGKGIDRGWSSARREVGEDRRAGQGKAQVK